MYLHRRIFFFRFFNMLLYTILFFSLPPETCPILVCMFLSIYFSHTCVAVLCVRVSVHFLANLGKQKLTALLLVSIAFYYTCTCVTIFFCPPVLFLIFLYSILYLFLTSFSLSLSLSFQHIHIIQKSLQQK